MAVVGKLPCAITVTIDYNIPVLGHYDNLDATDTVGNISVHKGMLLSASNLFDRES